MATGSIRRRGRRWQLRVYLGRDPQTGRKRYEERTFPTREEAEKARGRLLADAADGKLSRTSATVGELLTQWLEVAEPGWEPRTIRDNRHVVHKRLMPAFGKLPLRRLDTRPIDAWYASLSREGLAASTIRRYHALLHRALEVGVEWEWLGTNPASRAHPPPVRQEERELPPPEDLRRVLAQATEELALALRVLAVVGCRRGELCGLRWSDLDTDGDRVTVTVRRRVTTGPDGELHVGPGGKTRRPRKVSLDAATAVALTEWRRTVVARALELGTGLDPNAYIFSDAPDGSEPWRPDRLTRAWGRLRVQAGVQNLRLHDLRHVAASWPIAQGVDVRTVGSRLGHASTQMTLDVYGHTMADDRAAADALAELLDGR